MDKGCLLYTSGRKGDGGGTTGTDGHTRNQLITEFLMHYLKTGSEDDMKAADIIADEVFEHTLKRIDELERQVRMLTTGRENIDGNKIWKKFHSEDISINELNEE